jgi:hypothetical protein
MWNRLDQETKLAAFFLDWEYVVDHAEKPWPWKPLQHILQAYLEMTDESTVTTSLERKSAIPEQITPGRFNNTLIGILRKPSLLSPVFSMKSNPD